MCRPQLSVHPLQVVRPLLGQQPRYLVQGTGLKAQGLRVRARSARPARILLARARAKPPAFCPRSIPRARRPRHLCRVLPLPQAH